jgi:hypothetical protein
MTNVGRQPASILGGGLRIEANVVGVTQQFSNNFIGLEKGKLFFRIIEAINDSSQWETTTNFRNGPDKYTLNLGGEAWGPGFTMQLDEKNAFAFGMKGRSLSMAHNFSSELAELLYNDFLVPQYWLRLENQTADLQHFTWIEYFGTYARGFEITEEHMLRAGATLKLLQGQIGAYLYLEDLDYEFHNDSLFSIYETNIRYGLSNNPFLRDSSISPSFRFVGNPSVGFDFGLEYEFRKDGGSSDPNCKQAPYLIKVGFSVVDIGSVKFTKGPNSRDYYADARDVRVADLLVGGFRDLDSVLNTLFQELPSRRTFKMQLPTSINFNIDYNIGKGFGLNGDFLISPRNISNFEKVNYISRVQITPRWESKWFGAYIPFRLSSQSNFGIGLTMRAGPLVIGTNNFLAYFGGWTVFHQDLHFALKIPIGNMCKQQQAAP